MNVFSTLVSFFSANSAGDTRKGQSAVLFLKIVIGSLGFSSVAMAQETIGTGDPNHPAIGPAPSYGIGGSSAILVKNWHFGTGGTIPNITTMSSEFYYHDQFNTIGNGSNYGAVTVAPNSANALNGQPIEGVNCPTVRSFFTDSLQTYLQPLNGATTVDPNLHNAGNGSFMAKWTLPYAGSWLGYDIVWETRVRYVTPPYFWFAIWTAGNLWVDGAEHDLVESFGYDNGNGNTNYDGRYWHSNVVRPPPNIDVVNYSSTWISGMSSVGISNWDPTVYHTWTWHYKADNTYEMFMDGIRIQYGNAPYDWTLATGPLNQTLDINFLFDAGWGHTQVASVDHTMPASNFTGKFYEWNYSRVYLVPATVAPPAPTGLVGLPENSGKVLLRWDLMPYASSYNIYRGTSPGGESATAVAVGLKSLSFIDTGLTDGVTYYYKVAGVNSVGTSPYSNEVSVTPVPTYTVDDADSACTYVGVWKAIHGDPGYYGTGYHHDERAGSGKSATYTPTLPTAGNYEVFFRSPEQYDFADNMPVDINYVGGKKTVTVNERINNNIWVSLGTYAFNAGTGGNIVIRDDLADGYVIADAIRWIPAPPSTTDVDIGSPGVAGSGSYDSSVWVVEGSGSDISQASDHFNYDYRSVTGDTTIVARVTSQQNTDPWAKSGVMIRETTSTYARQVDVMMTPGNGVAMDYRSSTSGTTAHLAATNSHTVPYWVKLVRAGNTFTGYASSNGANWTQIGTVTVAMATTATEGLAVCSHNNSVLNTSTFDNVTMSP